MFIIFDKNNWFGGQGNETHLILSRHARVYADTLTIGLILSHKTCTFGAAAVFWGVSTSWRRFKWLQALDIQYTIVKFGKKYSWFAWNLRNSIWVFGRIFVQNIVIFYYFNPLSITRILVLINVSKTEIWLKN